MLVSKSQICSVYQLNQSQDRDGELQSLWALLEQEGFFWDGSRKRIDCEVGVNFKVSYKGELTISMPAESPFLACTTPWLEGQSTYRLGIRINLQPREEVEPAIMQNHFNP